MALIKIKNQPKMPRIGNIRIGIKTIKDGKLSYPKAVDYFVCQPTLDIEANIAHFQRLFGEKPKELDILFVSNNIEDCVKHEFDIRNSAGKQIGYSDGETAWVYNPATKQKDLELKFDSNDFKDYLKDYPKATIHERMVLFFVLPNFPVMGSWKFETKGSKTTIKEVMGVLYGIQNAAGRISGIQFKISVNEVIGDTIDVRKYPVVTLIPQISGFDAIKLASLSEAERDTLPFLINSQTLNRSDNHFIEAGQSSTNLLEDLKIAFEQELIQLSLNYPDLYQQKQEQIKKIQLGVDKLLNSGGNIQHIENRLNDAINKLYEVVGIQRLPELF